MLKYNAEFLFKIMAYHYYDVWEDGMGFFQINGYLNEEK